MSSFLDIGRTIVRECVSPYSLILLKALKATMLSFVFCVPSSFDAVALMTPLADSFEFSEV
jgi:hypothetical protein